MSEYNITELFELCDSDKSGFIEKEELKSIIPNVDNVELEHLLSQLDTDGDGRISLSELEKGLHDIIHITDSENGKNNSIPKQHRGRQRKGRYIQRFDTVDEEMECLCLDTRQNSEGSGFIRSRSCGDLNQKAPIQRTLSQMTTADDSLALDKKNSTIDLFRSLDSHNEAFQVYCHLAQEDAQMLQKFEVFLEEAIQRIKEKSKEKEDLEKVFEDEKRKQQARLAALEEEAEIMSKRIEQRTVQQLNSKFETDRAAYEEEITTLNENLETMKQLEQSLKQQAKSELNPLKHKLNEMEKLLRKLESEKLEAETNALLAKSQLAAYKQSMEQHSADRENDKEVVLDYMTEQINLARQVKELQEANKHLHETNADLQGEMVLLKRKLTKRQKDRMSLPLSTELQHAAQSPTENILAGGDRPDSKSISEATTLSLSEELELASEAFALNHQLSIDEIDGDIRDGMNSPLHSQTRNQQTSPRLIVDRRDRSSICESQSISSHNGSAFAEHPQSPANCFSPSSVSSDPYHSYHNRLDRVQSTSSNTTLLSSSYNKSVDWTPQRIYKVVFAGDAGVGKSSFIIHLCKGIFQTNISSTLGIDFHTKNVELGDERVALQLWDTAGQERFRCISTSYFRKADGVVLMYDCCSERSFVSLREWVECIRDSTDTDSLPIMICANKIDAREEREQQGFKVITKSMGEKLAEECKTMFCEISAKTGDQLHATVQKLGKVMKEREDEGLHKYEIGLHLHDNKKIKKTGCCS